MATASQTEHETYRVIILARGGTEVLLVPDGSRLLLPSVSIPQCQRVAENLTAAVKSEWGEEVVCLFTLDRSAAGVSSEQVRYQVAEHWRTGGEPHASMQWIPASGLSGDLFTDQSDYGAIQQSVAKCRGKTPDEEPGPFVRLGWFRELCQWVETVAASEGLHLNGQFHQSNASPTFSLIRFETNSPALWFKAVGEPNQREYPITRTLAKLFPDYLPAILGERLDWNGWLTKEAQGSNLAETQDYGLWEAAASALARLQIDSIGHGERIRAVGAHDLRIACLCDIVQPFLEAMAELMDRQTKTPPAVLSRAELACLGEHVRETLVMLKDLGIPDTLGHLDLNPGNIVVSPDRCAFLDWAEAYVGHPFFSLRYLLEHLRRAAGMNSPIEGRLVESYFAPWELIVSRNAITAAFDLSPLLAVFAYAAGSNIWRHRKTQGTSHRWISAQPDAANTSRDEPAGGSEATVHALMEPPPYSPVEAVTEVLHGVPVTDPYRWLEDQESPETREWIRAQTRYARSYLGSIRGRERIRERIRQVLDVETYDSVQKVGNRYFFRKRVVGQEQPCICVREGMGGPDQMLVDPALRGTAPHIAVRPIRISPDGRLLLYEVKQGGERTGAFEILDIATLEILPDKLPRGYLRGFAFAPDARAFYYVHEPLDGREPHRRAAYKHVLGRSFADDEEVFAAGHEDKLRLHVIPGPDSIGLLVLQFDESTRTDFYVWPFDDTREPEPVIRGARYTFGPLLLRKGRILAITDQDAPNYRIVEIRPSKGRELEFVDLVPNSDSRIQSWVVCGDRIFVSYLRDLQTEIEVFDLSGDRVGRVPVNCWDSIRLLGGSEDGDELFFERESFTKPVQICSYRPATQAVTVWAKRRVPIDSEAFCHTQVWFPAKDGTRIPMFLVGRPEVLDGGIHPAIMTSYGGYGVPMTPQFSVFVAFLLERGCLFALPNIRGGSEFGAEWHEAARRRRRQVAFDDFIAAGEWLIQTGRTQSQKLAIFGGSNSGLLVGAAMTQRPDLFRAVVCMVPMLDMLRYHLFDNAHVWNDEFGTAEDPEDFRVLLGYSPYHNIRDGASYPATMIVSGDSDQNCNPLHARKMAARLQAANASEHPIFLDYSPYRGHSPVLPLSQRIEALTDRMAFLCDQLQLSV